MAWSLGQSAGLEERRLLTVAFGDMVGSTALGEAIGPDSMHGLMKLYQSACTQAVIENDGVLSSWMGDGFSAFFGYPSEHEDAAVRAVEAGLAVVAAIERLGPEFERRFKADVRIRVGIHTGLVVLSRVPGREDDPNAAHFVGETPNIAARIEATALPNSVAISEATYKLVEGFFDVEPLGPQDLKGVSRKVHTFRALRRTAAASRYLASSDRLTPLIGRDSELRRLQEIAVPRSPVPPTTCALFGEPGLGKTRLLHELLHWIGPSRDALYCFCTPRTVGSPLYPFIQLVRAIPLDSEGGRSSYASLAGQLRALALDDVAIARLALLAGIDGGPQLPLVTAEQALRDTAAAVVSWLGRRAAAAGTLLMIDDVQWIDPTSRTVIEQLAGQEDGLVVIMACRPEPDSRNWLTSLCTSTVELGPLSKEEILDLICHVSGADDSEVDAAAERADGVPLFAEELARMLESGELAGLGSIPNSLHDLIHSRLDRIPEAKGLAQLGASIGREFEFDLLKDAADLHPDMLHRQAEFLESAQIWDKEVVHGRPGYAFRHVLIQEAAYDSQLQERKQQIHERIAGVLTKRGDAESAAGLATIADHLQHAGPDHQLAAIEAWANAGFATANDGAHHEAITHFSTGLKLFQDLGEPIAPLELRLRLGLGASLSSTVGYGQDHVKDQFERAYDLCQEMGNPPELFWVLWGLWTFYLVRGEYPKAGELARACADIAAAVGDPALEIEGAAALGITSFYQGRLTEAADRLAYAAARYRETRAISGLQRFQHPAVAALAHLGLLHWWFGDGELARHTVLEAAELAEGCEEHLCWFAREYASTFCAALGAYMEDTQFCGQHAQVAIDICTRHGSQMFLAGARIYKGFAQARSGEVPEGVSLLEAACKDYFDTGATLFRPYHLTRLALAREAAGQRAAALEALNEAVRLAEANGELVHLPEVLRLRAEMLLAHAPEREEEARADLERSLELAQAIGSTGLYRRLEQRLSAHAYR